MKTTREKLYEEIWKEPVSKVAIKYGVSDQAIRKKCKKYNIPLPSNKYWGNLHAGKKPKPDPLPKHTGENEIEFFNTYEPGIEKVKEEKSEHVTFACYDEYKRNLLLKLCSNIKVNEHLNNPHVEIIKHKTAIKEAKKDRYYSSGIIDLRGLHIGRQAVLDTGSTSEQTLPKAYRFLDSLIKVIEKAGGKIEITQEKSFFIIENERVFFKLKEKYNQIRYPANQRIDKWRDYDLEPSGFLKVIIGYENIRGPRYSEFSREFKESASNTLDKLIKNVFTFIFELPQKIKEDRIAYQKQLEEERKREDEKRRIAEIHDTEFKRTKELIKRAKQYETSQMLYRYLDHLYETCAPKEYIEWVKEKARWFDPIDKQEDTILNEQDKTALTQDDEKPIRYGYFW